VPEPYSSIISGSARRNADTKDARYDVSPQEFAGWLGGLELVDPGVCAAVHLRPGWKDAPEVPHGQAYAIGAIGRKA
jgi:hypothetical protein